jgi:hypothetical protein
MMAASPVLEKATEETGDRNRKEKEMRKRSIVIAAMILFVLAAATAALAADDPFAGTWKTNMAKSQVSTSPGAKSNIAKLQAIENGLKIEQDIVEADGKASHREYSWILNGKDFPYPDNSALTMNCTRTDAYTIICTVKTKNGIEVGRIEDVLSKDGKTGTVTTTGRTAKGETIREVMVNERQ